MKPHPLSVAPLLVALSLVAAHPAYAAAPVGQINQLSGFVMAVKPGGALKLLSPQSVVEAGDTLLSENGSYVGIRLADGRQAVLGPNTRLKFSGETALSLAAGQLEVTTTVLRAGAAHLTIEAGGNTVDAGAASFILSYRPDPRGALAQRAYARASVALAASNVSSDAREAGPLWQKVAQVTPPSTSTSGGSAPGLYVQVLDGLIHVSNGGGSQIFAAGQFGFTPSFQMPPIILPHNPGLQFTPPPTFSASGPTSTGTIGPKSNTVDCEVR